MSKAKAPSKTTSHAVLIQDGHSEQLFTVTDMMLSNAEFADITAKAALHKSDDFWGDESDSCDWRNYYRPYNVNEDGTLVVNITGVLLDGFPYQFSDWATGYEYIRRVFERGMEDGNVKRIMMFVKSGGGAALECFELGDALRDLKAEYNKPIHGHAVMAFSAAYSIISIADTISVTRTGMTGSIGVLTVHRDYSKALEKMGIAVSEITSGALKADGSPNKPLGTDARGRIQLRSDELYDEFVEQIHLNRGMSREDIRATEAGIFSARQSVEIGLADEVASFEMKLAEYSTVGSSEMSTKNQNGGEAATFTQADLDAARLSGVEEGKSEGVKEGATAASARHSEVTGHELFKGREATANKLLANQALSAKDIIETLETIPAAAQAVAQPAQQAQGGAASFNQLDAAMGKTPAVGAEGADAEDEGGSELKGTKAVNSLLASYDTATGGARKPKA